MHKVNILKTCEEILEKYYWAELACINEFSSDAEIAEEALTQEVEEYKNKKRFLLIYKSLYHNR